VECCPPPAASVPERRPFARLADLLGDDPAPFQRILKAFCLSTLFDLADMDYAAARGLWPDVRKLANRIRSGCHCVKESNVAETLTSLCEAVDDRETRRLYLSDYAARRAELLALIREALRE
jgi:hypothetical protein